MRVTINTEGFPKAVSAGEITNEKNQTILGVKDE